MAYYFAIPDGECRCITKETHRRADTKPRSLKFSINGWYIPAQHVHAGLRTSTVFQFRVWLIPPPSPAVPEPSSKNYDEQSNLRLTKDSKSQASIGRMAVLYPLATLEKTLITAKFTSRRWWSWPSYIKEQPASGVKDSTTSRNRTPASLAVPHCLEWYLHH